MGKSGHVRWGILGTGGIAGAFASSVAGEPGQVVQAVGSRSLKTARDFADRYGIPGAYGSYDALVSDPSVDIVYVATPHPFHSPNTLLALGAGKPALVEKPFALDGTQAREMATLAREKGLFLMEAMVTRFLPHTAKIRSILASGEVGTVVLVEADRGEAVAFDPAHRLFDPSVGGGALLDLGVYPLSFVSMVLGTPDSVSARGTWASSGVEDQVTVDLGYGSGARALVGASLRTRTPNRAGIVGTKGRIEIDDLFCVPTGFTVFDRRNQVVRRHENGFTGTALGAEAAEAARCVRAGLTESPLMPVEESVTLMDTLDRIRAELRR